MLLQEIEKNSQAFWERIITHYKNNSFEIVEKAQLEGWYTFRFVKWYGVKELIICQVYNELQLSSYCHL
jgi:hypothetical protein